ncbi:MAG: penicillin acylase family protein, partial [Pseudomonadota bacterium]
FFVRLGVGAGEGKYASADRHLHIKPYKKDKMEIISGDSYVFYARFGENGLEELQTVNAFGNSLKEGHPHSTDQTEMYVKQQTKAAELDRQKLRSSGRSYHPK